MTLWGRGSNWNSIRQPVTVALQIMYIQGSSKTKTSGQATCKDVKIILNSWGPDFTGNL